MKYFTKILLEDGWSDDKKRKETSAKKWELNRKKYWKQIKNILPELPKPAQILFPRVNFHDGSLTSFTICEHKKSKYKRSCNAYIQVMHPDPPFYYYILKYTQVRRCFIDYPSNTPFEYYPDEFIIGDWYCDELTLTDDKWMRHEILFHSGSTILLEFKGFSYKKRKSKSPW